MTRGRGIIDISLDFSKAEALVAKTLIQTIQVEDKVASLQTELKITDDGLNLTDSLMDELDIRAGNIDDEIQFHRVQQNLIEEKKQEHSKALEQQRVEQEKIAREQERIDTQIKSSVSSGLSALRRTAAFGTYIFQAIGFSIGQSLTLLAETVSLTIETAQVINALEFVEGTTNPVLFALKAGGIAVRLGLIALLVALQAMIINEKQKVSQEFNSIVGAMRIITL